MIPDPGHVFVPHAQGEGASCGPLKGLGLLATQVRSGSPSHVHPADMSSRH